MTKEEIAQAYAQLQDHICQTFTSGGMGIEFQEDSWDRPGGGGGRSRVITDGLVVQKGGVGYSSVHGQLPEKIADKLGLDEGVGFLATGVSIVLHPRNPYCPIIHMNVRYFEMETGLYWFGGGIDLTPHYVDLRQAQWFHEQLQGVCDQYDPSFYPKFKDWADDYFYLSHRKETRGVGGIFYDHLKPGEPLDKETLLAYSLDLGRLFGPTYLQLLEWNKDLPYGEREIGWQNQRRSRYVEFNLVHDKGTKFGLDTDGRTESILMSMPPVATWGYNLEPEPGSREAQTVTWLRKGVNWLDPVPA